MLHMAHRNGGAAPESPGLRCTSVCHPRRCADPVDDGRRRPARTVRLSIVQPCPLVFGLDEAAQSGLSAAAVRHGLRTGRFVRLRRGLFCDATLWQRTGASPMARRVLETRAAWLAIGRRGWASHYTAALLHGLPVPYGQPAA